MCYIPQSPFSISEPLMFARLSESYVYGVPVCTALNLNFSCQFICCWLDYLASQKNQRRERRIFPLPHNGKLGTIKIQNNIFNILKKTMKRVTKKVRKSQAHGLGPGEIPSATAGFYSNLSFVFRGFCEACPWWGA